MEPHPLTDSRAKLARAREHLDKLEADLPVLLSSYEYGWEVEHDVQKGVWNGYILVKPPSPSLVGPTTSDFAMLASECGAAIRSALDFLVYQLSMHDQAGGIRPDDKGVRTQFPIFLRKTDYASRRDRMLAGVSETNRLVIDEHQPFQRRQRRAIHLHPLTIVDWLTNTDKHRLAHTTAVFRAQDSPVEVTLAPIDPVVLEPGTQVRVEMGKGNYGQLEERTHAFTVSTSKPVREADVSVYRSDVMLDLAIGERRLNLGMLEKVHQYVTALVERFRPAFGS